MANLVMGAISSIIPKLYQLLEEEYDLQSSVKKRIRSLTLELELAQVALCKVAEVPWDQLDKQVQIWARQVREASYDMEDVLDTFIVRVKGPESSEEKKNLLKKMTNFFKKSKARRKISGDVKNIMSHLQEVTEQCRRYKVEDIGPRTATASTIDPRLHAMYTHASKLVGMDKSSGELMSKLQLYAMSDTKMKTVSIVGIGGLGKTTLAKAVYENLRENFNCRAFVSVGRNPDLQKVLQMILFALDKERYGKFDFAVLQDITQFIDELREFLHDNKRCSIIVMDDIWEKQSWEILKLAISNDKICQGRIIITTRKWEVANNADEVYELPPLPYGSSRKLFYSRIYGDEGKCVDYYQQPDEVSDEILRKCAGIPLAIITMASLLVHKPRDKWIEVHKSIGFGSKGSEDAENTMRILSFSYYDLPSHLRTCLLYLSAFPEDSVIPKASLVWMWIAEGFVQKQKGNSLFEIGEGYFNDLINRSMIQEAEPDFYGDNYVRDYRNNYVRGCRVHDMVLDFIRSMSSEENFFIVLDKNDQATLVQSNVLVRRMAHHNKIMVRSNPANMFDMSKVRSFFALEWVIDTWAPLSSFRLLRVLSIGHYDIMKEGSCVGIEHLGHLLHLRFLGINGLEIKKIPKEIGALKMLQTLDLFESFISELPSSSSLPTQLVCLRIAVPWNARNVEMFSVERLTSLEELSIHVLNSHTASRRLLKELGNLRELRVLDTPFRLRDEEMKRDSIESVRHLHKLQHLKIGNSFSPFDPIFWEREMEFVLPGDLRTLELYGIVLWKLPSCVDPLCHRKLSHMDLSLRYMDEQELRTLGRLPELRFLGLDLRGSSSTIRNISDNDACYFPKLRCLRLKSSMVLFVANKGDEGKKTISFHIWDGEDDSTSDWGNNEFSSVFQSEMGREKSGEELQLLSVCDDVPSVSDEENKEDSISIKEGEGERAAMPRFMPNLEVLHFHVREQAVRNHPNCCYNLGLEFLSSLRQINIVHTGSLQEKEVKAALRSASRDHPNQPTLRIRMWD